jgi:betaine-aldehyde dehydrogenase
MLGLGATVGQAIVESPSVDFISFTGSTATRRRAISASSTTVKKVSLELSAARWPTN